MKQILFFAVLFFLNSIAFGQTESVNREFSRHYNRALLQSKLKKQSVSHYTDKTKDDYCIPTGMDCSSGDGIQGFALANVDNLSSGCSPDGYGDFLNMNIEVYQGSFYTLKATAAYTSNNLSLWIDYNNDSVFDADEKIISEMQLPQNEIAETEIRIKPDATPGTYRLRAYGAYQGFQMDPCAVYSYGECEDYTLTIAEPNHVDIAVTKILIDDAVPTGDLIPKALVVALGNQLSSFTVTMTDGQGYSSTVTIDDMTFGEIREVAFDTYSASAGSVDFEACANIANDINSANDCSAKTIEVQDFDAGVIDINFGASVFPGEKTPSLKVKNFAQTAGDGQVELKIGDYTSTKSFTNLEPLATLWVEMDAWTAAVGDYTIDACLISDDANSDNNCISRPIAVLNPEAKFIANETVVLTGLSLSFFDKSDYVSTAWQWTFEGGTPSTSTEASPTVTYNTPGVYDVELTITHADGTETITKENYIEVSDEVLASYEIINDVNTLPLYKVFFVNENLGFGHMGSANKGKYAKTTDGGDNWEVITVPNINKTITSIFFLDESNGFFRTSEYGTPTQVYSTSDGGANWEFYAAGAHSQQFRFDAYDKDHVIICGQQSVYDVDMAVTSSGPSGWHNLLSPEADPWSQYQGVQFLSQDTIFAMRFMDVNFSYDGGTTWTNKDFRSLWSGGWENFGVNDVHFPDNKNVGFAAGTHYNDGGGMIFKSTNNGENWEELGRGFDEGRNVHFFDENIGLVSGYNGFVYKTSDGGETWYGTNLNEGNIGSNFVVNENLMFVCVQGKCYRSKNGFFQQPLGTDLTINELDMPSSVLVDNAPFTLKLAVENVGRNPVDTYSLSYQVDNGDIISQDYDPEKLFYNNVLTSDTFAVAWNPEPGEYDIKIWINKVDGAADDNQTNDTLTHHVLVTSDQWDNRKVLLEEATGTWCGYCVNGILTVEALEENFNTDKTRIIPVALHGNDQWEIESGEVILNAYSGGSYPKGWVDRTQFFGEASIGLETGKWGAYSEQQIGINAPMNVSIKTLINENTRSLEIQTKASFFADVNCEMHFNCYIVEDSLIASQANNYNTVTGHPYYGLGNPIPDFVHMHVLRDILEDPWGVQGELPTSVSNGDEYEHTFQYTVPADFDINNISVVCFVTKHNEEITQREVLNANVSKYNEFEPIGIEDIQSRATNLSVYPNPASRNITVQWNESQESMATVEIKNYLGQSIYKENIATKTGLNKKNISLENIESGVYFICIKGSSYSVLEKVIIQ